MNEPDQHEASQPEPYAQRDQVRADAAFKHAQAAMQMGDWAQAIALLQQVEQRFPGDDLLEALLAECHFKADFDRTTATVKPKRSTRNWRRLASFGLMAGTVMFVLLLGATVMRERLFPLMAETAGLTQQAELLDQARAALAGEKFDEAEQLFNELLGLAPASTAAQEGLVAVAQQRDLARQYEAAQRLFVQDDYAGALKGFGALQMVAPNYKNVNSLILEVRKFQQLETLYEQAQTQIYLGYKDIAVATYSEIQSVSTTYRAAEIKDTLYQLNLELGRGLIELNPPDPALVPVALDRFNAALRQRPSDPEASVDQRLATDYMTGSNAYQRSDWPQAVERLQALFSQRPNYLGAAVPPLLYQAYINNGDLYRSNNDLYKAYDQYRLAAELPISDTVIARGRMAEIQPLLTPTPTPAPTLPPASPAPSATPTPTPTPRPMLAFQGRIIFKSDNVEQPGYWVMDSDGGGREYLGPFEMYDRAVDAYRETERLSPDGQYRVQVGDVDKRAQVLLAKTFDVTFPPRPLTRHSKIAYDPVWSPDGSLVAYVTQANESDDIWVISPDGATQESLVRNPWEWEKHPSWSPDSTRIAFMSNREGTLAVWVMERNGRNPRNISNVPWPEYDPVWVK